MSLSPADALRRPNTRANIPDNGGRSVQLARAIQSGKVRYFGANATSVAPSAPLERGRVPRVRRSAVWRRAALAALIFAIAGIYPSPDNHVGRLDCLRVGCDSRNLPIGSLHSEIIEKSSEMGLLVVGTLVRSAADYSRQQPFRGGVFWRHTVSKIIYRMRSAVSPFCWERLIGWDDSVFQRKLLLFEIL